MSINNALLYLRNKYNSAPIQMKASIWFLICSFLQKGISVIITPIFTRIMTTSEYGEFGTFYSWLAIVEIIVSLQLSQGVFTQGLIKFEEERKLFASSMQGLNCILCILWGVVYFGGRQYWNSIIGFRTDQMVYMLLLIWVGAAFNFWAVEQRVILNYKKLVYITLIVSVLQPIIGVLLVIYSDDKVTARIISVLAVCIVGYAWPIVTQVLNGKSIFSKKYWLYALKFNIPLVPHYLSQTVLNSSDRIMINQMVGASEAGIYTLGYSLSSMMLLFNTALLHTINPWIFQRIKSKEITDIPRVAYAALIVIASVNIGLIAFAPEIVKVFGPAEYSIAMWIIPPVSMSSIFMFAYCLFADFEFYYEKTTRIMIASVVCAALNIVLNYYCIDRFGFIAAGYTTLLCYLLFSLAHYTFMIQITRVHFCSSVYDPKVLCVIFISFMCLGFMIMCFYNSLPIRIVIIIIVFIFALFRKNELLNLVKSVINNK